MPEGLATASQHALGHANARSTAYGVAVVAQILIFPVFGLNPTLTQNLMMGTVFSIVSITRSFALRRLFEAIRMRHAERRSAAR